MVCVPLTHHLKFSMGISDLIIVQLVPVLQGKINEAWFEKSKGKSTLKSISSKYYEFTIYLKI